MLSPRRWRRPLAAVGVLAAVVAPTGVGAQAPDVPVCAPGAGVVTMSGTVEATAAKTYSLHPFEVADGTTRVEVGYRWEPGDGTTFDLGLWDADGDRSPEGFRGWGGSREGRLDKGMSRAWVQADSAERAFTPGRVEPGTWSVELGAAEVAPAGATWTVELECTDPDVGPEVDPDPVDPDHVANPDPGWYHGDFHMHGYHSNPEAPDQDEFVRYSRDAGLDFLPVTEYVVGRHWQEWGATQRANPDLLIWPGREVITYFGHAIVVGETPSTIEYRQGFDGITLADVQSDSLADGALFGIAHPTVFPEAQFGSTCRGCEFQLADVVDLDRVDTVEILTDEITYGDAQNPFVATALGFWDSLLRDGHRVTAVSGSDDKLGPGLGTSATAVYADELSRDALRRAVRAGHAYVQTRGALRSPTVEFTATPGEGADGGESGAGADDVAMMGDTVVGDAADATVEVTDAVGQRLRVVRNGEMVAEVPIDASPFVHTFVADRTDDEGPLGTYWRVEIADDRSLTAVTNPIFVADRAPVDDVVTTTTAPDVAEGPTATPSADAGRGMSWRNPWTAMAAMAVVTVGLILARRAVRRR